MSNKTKEAQNDEEEKHYRKKILTFTQTELWLSANSNFKSSLHDKYINLISKAIRHNNYWCKIKICQKQNLCMIIQMNNIAHLFYRIQETFTCEQSQMSNILCIRAHI